MNKQHPVYYILLSLGTVLLLSAGLELLDHCRYNETFWQAAALSTLGLIAVLSLDAFRCVSRLYPCRGGGRTKR